MRRLAAFLALLALVTTQQSPSPALSSVPPATPPSQAQTLAASAAVEESSVSAGYDSRQIGKCICDVTGGQCDANCCCDTTDCDAQEILAFTECLPEGPAPSTVLMCSDRGTDVVRSRQQSMVVGSQLCVVFNNNPSMGKFFPDLVISDPSEFDSGALDPSFLFSAPPSPAAETAPEVFYVGDWIPASTLGNDSTTPNGFFSIPVPDGSGGCADGNPVRFMTEVPETACWRSVTSLATDCEALLTFERFATDLTISANPGSSSGMIPVTACSESSCGYSALTSAFWNATSSTCQNAVTSVSYTVGISGQQVSSVTAVVTLGNVTSNTFVQTFSVEFLRQGSIPSTAVHRSGNPGYLVGKPVLLGTLSGGVVSFGPLQMLGTSSTGNCDLSSGPAISFGEDMVSGCFIDLPTDSSGCPATEASLATLTRAGAQPSHVGAWGNVSSAISSDWIDVSDAVPTAESCKFITEIEYRFMVARQGSLDNPQNRIVSARVSYRTSTLTDLELCTGILCRTRFELRSIASFVWVPDDGLFVEWVPRPPPVFPSLPDDILYPFRFSSGISSVSSFSSFVLAIVALAFQF